VPNADEPPDPRPPSDPDATQERTPSQAGASAEPTLPVSIPGYEILAEIGRGAMGRVYRARQLGFEREVAVKTLLHVGEAGPALARFWAEAEVLAALDHPHVVRVFEFGLHAGRPFLAMELARGGSLAARLRAGPLPPPDAVALTEKVARGVAAAHALGVTHRDLKPANVLLTVDRGAWTADREVQDAVDDALFTTDRPLSTLSPKVADFGIAKWQPADLTRTRAVMGSPAYMSPEQAAGRAAAVGPPADVWALGVLLYECVAGRRPFDGATGEELLWNVVTTEPVPLRDRAAGLPPGLDRVVSKCLAKQPERRYPSAAELADDLGRVLRGERVSAPAEGLGTRLGRWAGRFPLGSRVGVGAVALAAVLVVWFRGEAAAARRDAESARAEAGHLVAWERYGRAVQAAHQAARDGHPAEAHALLAGTRPDLRGWEYDFAHGRAAPVIIPRDAAGRPDGPAAADDWDANTAAVRLQLRAPAGRAGSASLSPDRTRVVTAGDGPLLRVWSAASGVELLALPGRAPAWFSADGTRLFAGNDGRTVVVYDGRPPAGE